MYRSAEGSHLWHFILFLFFFITVVSTASVVPSVSMEMYGGAVNYSCTGSFSAGDVSGVFWFLNGAASAASELVVTSVQHTGFYQCLVVLNNGDMFLGERYVVPTGEYGRKADVYVCT